MSKLIIISNRLPVTVSAKEEKIEYSESIGGLATGLKSCHEQAGSLWLGWLGVAEEELPPPTKEEIKTTLKSKYKCVPIFLSQEEVEQYYLGFSNNTIWPLFHYFTSKTEYSNTTWEYYKAVNEKFYNAVNEVIEKDDVIWVHDYQLMLLPDMIRADHPDVKIGFFLHIPFPSFELFRLLPNRLELLEGLLGADLIGFHTYDYARHFLSSVRRIAGYESKLYDITREGREIKIDAFPMGIDYERFTQKPKEEEISQEVKELVFEKKIGETFILSVDRLDYSKGIPERINAFRDFLIRYPEQREKVRLNLIVAPSRVEIKKYEELLQNINELVSEVNSTFGTFNWMPIWFLFRSFSQEDLIAFYRNSEILLVTPLRDGMNLVVKEYIASRQGLGGVAVISETAGAASELPETVIVNANDSHSIVEGLYTALRMPIEEQIIRAEIMQRRLKQNNVEYWAKDFLSELEKSVEKNTKTTKTMHIANGEKMSELLDAYERANTRLILLDYDGTLIGFKPTPEQAVPDEELKRLLSKLTADEKNIVIISSGRDKDFLEKWFSDIDRLSFTASHGLWVKLFDSPWNMTAAVDNEWKESVRPVMEMYRNRMPGAHMEEKEFSLAFHYRCCEPDSAEMKLSEMKEALGSMIASSPLMFQEGSKVLEIKDNRFNKGNVIKPLSERYNADFILAAGDDLTDEDIFKALPDDAYSIKLGGDRTAAKYRIKTWQLFRKLLTKLSETDGEDA